MKRKLSAILAVLCTSAASNSVLASVSKEAETAFSVVFISQISADGPRAQERARITETRIAATQHVLQRNPGIANRLRARGIQITNIVDQERAFDGSLILYVR